MEPIAPSKDELATTKDGGKAEETFLNGIQKAGLQRRTEYSVPRGYSSGASSYAGSEADDDDFHSDGQTGRNELQRSRHSDILALSSLRQEMVADGDLTKTVVRIEVRSPKSHRILLNESVSFLSLTRTYHDNPAFVRSTN